MKNVYNSIIPIAGLISFEFLNILKYDYGASVHVFY